MIKSGSRLFYDIKHADIAANFTDPMYKGIYDGVKVHKEDLDHVLKRCWDYDFDKILITGNSLELSKEALEIAKTDSRLYSTVGCHPLKCNEFDSYGEEYYYDALLKLAKDNSEKVTAIGELGLDYHPSRIHECSKDMQLKFFDLQIAIAYELALPVFLRCRHAFDDMHNILNYYYGRLRGVIHSFVGTKEEARKFLDLGFYIGLSGCSLKTTDQINVVKYIPPDRMMIETDSPRCRIDKKYAGYKYIKSFLPSVPKKNWNQDEMVRGRSEPPHILEMLEAIGNIKDFDSEVLALITYKNAETIFFPVDTAAGNFSGFKRTAEMDRKITSLLNGQP